MQSPVKKIDLHTEADKENIEARYQSDEVAVPIKGIPEQAEEDVVATVAASDKEDLEDEPILRENAQRFVLFPIKYHEVSRTNIDTRRAQTRTSRAKQLLTKPL